MQYIHCTASSALQNGFLTQKHHMPPSWIWLFTFMSSTNAGKAAMDMKVRKATPKKSRAVRENTSCLQKQQMLGRGEPYRGLLSTLLLKHTWVTSCWQLFYCHAMWTECMGDTGLWQHITPHGQAHCQARLTNANSSKDTNACQPGLGACGASLS